MTVPQEQDLGDGHKDYFQGKSTRPQPRKVADKAETRAIGRYRKAQLRRWEREARILADLVRLAEQELTHPFHQAVRRAIAAQVAAGEQVDGVALAGQLDALGLAQEYDPESVRRYLDGLIDMAEERAA